MKYLPIDFNKESPLHNKYLSLTVGDLIDIIFSHNEIIELCVDETSIEDPIISYHKTIWRGHAHQLPNEYKDYVFRNRINNDNTSFRVGLTYNFGKQKLKRQI